MTLSLEKKNPSPPRFQKPANTEWNIIIPGWAPAVWSHNINFNLQLKLCFVQTHLTGKLLGKSDNLFTEGVPLGKVWIFQEDEIYKEKRFWQWHIMILFGYEIMIANFYKC